MEKYAMNILDFARNLGVHCSTLLKFSRQLYHMYGFLYYLMEDDCLVSQSFHCGELGWLFA
jgi:hypothetical protein